jgi:hypothetical protein
MTTVTEFLDGLEHGGYWDEWCPVCERTTTQPEGRCEESDCLTVGSSPAILGV